MMEHFVILDSRKIHDWTFVWNWLGTNVGRGSVSWKWKNLNDDDIIFHFLHKEDMIRFKLTWE